MRIKVDLLRGRRWHSGLQPGVPPCWLHQHGRAHPTEAAEKVPGPRGYSRLSPATQPPACAPKHSPAPRSCQGLGLGTPAPERAQSPGERRDADPAFCSPSLQGALVSKYKRKGGDELARDVAAHRRPLHVAASSESPSPSPSHQTTQPGQRPALPPIPHTLPGHNVSPCFCVGLCKWEAPSPHL